MYADFCDVYAPMNEKERELNECEVPMDIIDKGTAKEYKFINYIIYVLRKRRENKE